MTTRPSMIESNKIEIEEKARNKQLYHNFVLFIISLIFASLSLSLQFQPNPKHLPTLLKLCQVGSWVAFMMAGFLGLMSIRLSLSFSISFEPNSLFLKLCKISKEILMWRLFFLAVTLQILCRTYIIFTA